MRLRLLGGLALALLASIPTGAAAAQPPLGLDQCRQLEGIEQCSGLVPTWDGVPLDTTVTLPPGKSRRLPLIVAIHGFGNSKHEYLDPAETAYTGNAYAWARRGYAVLTYTARGLWGSCGTPEARLANPIACADGYIHLADVRYEVRDSQELIGRLVASGHVDRRRIGVTGDSYGGGQTLMLAALRDRTMLPSGKLAPWRDPDGRRLRIAAAAPVIPWTDLVTAAAPNGRVSAVGVTSRRKATNPVGVAKATVINAIFAAAQFAVGPGQPVGEPFVPGRPMGYLAVPGSDPEADVTRWVARTDAGEPYTDAEARAIVDRLVRFHSPYYVDPGRRPPPLLLASGFTDDLFPVDEVLRYANRTRKLYPRAEVSMLLGDFGHQRAANKPRERRHLLRRIQRFFDHHLQRGPRPPGGVTAYVQTCPRSEPPRGPLRARRFIGLSRRKLRSVFTGARTVSSTGGDPAVGRALDPAAGGGDGCVVVEPNHPPGVASYTLRPPRRRAVTLLGAPRLQGRLSIRGAEAGVAQLAARLWDVAPDGRARRLVARGLYRPEQGRNRWQLHPGAWRFRPGHAIELELLGNDAPYGRPSNGAFEVDVERLRAVLPIR